MPFKWALDTKAAGQAQYQAIAFYGPFMVVDTNQGEIREQQPYNVPYKSTYSSRDNVIKTPFVSPAGRGLPRRGSCFGGGSGATATPLQAKANG